MNRYTFIIIFELLLFSVNAQPGLKFVRYTTKQGLVNNDVLSICQDNYGFIWIGTKKGCSKFNGIDFVTYKYNENDSCSIGEGWVNDILLDNKNRLWFALAGPTGTLMRFDYENECFIDVSAKIKAKINTDKEILSFWSIFQDSDGLIWSNNSVGIISYNPENEDVKVFGNSYNDSFDMVYAQGYFEDDKKNVWFSFPDGVFIFNKETDEFTHHKIPFGNNNNTNPEKCVFIYKDKSKHAWIGTYNGLVKFYQPDLGASGAKRYYHDAKNPNSLSSNIIYDVLETEDYIYFATINGLCLNKKGTDEFFRYYSDEYDEESINSNLVRELFCDRQNNIWIGTNSGVAKLQVKKFKSYMHSFYRNSISHNKVDEMCQVSDSVIWIATPKGVDAFNIDNNKFYPVIDVSYSDKGLYGSPMTLFPDNEGGVLIGMWNGGGLSRYDLTTKKVENNIFKSVKAINDELGSLFQSSANVFNVFCDEQNNIWVSIQREGIICYNPKTKLYKHFSHDNKNPNSLSSNEIKYIMQDSDKNIWICTDKGVNVLNLANPDSITRFVEECEVNHIIEASDKNLWIATNTGLYRLDYNMIILNRFDVNSGLPGNEIQGIVEDHNHNLWVTTDYGLAQFNFSPGAKPGVLTYKQEEGLNVGDFIKGSCLKTNEGKILFGGTGGFCIFDPADIKMDTRTPVIVFTNLKVSNREVRIGQEINNQVILQKSIAVTGYLTFNHKNNNFSIQFSGLNYNLPQYNQYCYKLEGYDSPDAEWNFPPLGERELKYMNLPAGEYVLKVKAANSYGIWNNEPAELKIKILPPWWQTLWFKSLAVAILVFIVLMVIRIRTYNLQKQKRRLKKIVELRTVELKEANEILKERQEELQQQAEQLADMNKKLLETNTDLEIKTTEVEKMARIVHEADQSKLRFFANVSHEFRTPLSLIISPLEKCLSLEKPVDWDNIKSNYLQLMHRNSKRLLRLINQVIDFRKIEQGRKQLNLSNSNIVEFTKEIIDVFSTLSEQKNINLGVESQYPVIDFMFDTDIMEKILYNLISNAIKYTQEGGDVSIQLSVNSEQSAENSDQLPVSSNQLTENNQQSTVNSNQSYDSPLNTDNCLLITVKDTGVGISKENLNKIFDRFYRVDNMQNFEEEGGTGIGLAYTKELIELHKGTISVESEPHKGTTFTACFPFDEKIYGKEIIKDTNPVNLAYTRSMIEHMDDTFESGFDKTNVNVDKTVDDDLQENKPRILIVEDNTDLRKFIKNELTTHFNVYEATNGKEGLELAIEVEPELIISDIMMPVMNGIELCEKIKTNENTSHIPVILLTAKGSDEDQIKGLETGANDYIPKPFNVNVLKIKINNLFQLRKHMQEKFSKSINVTPSEITFSLLDQQFIQKAIEVVNENIHDYEFDNDAFVSLMNLGRTQVYGKIKNITNQSLSEFIRSIRLKAAAKLFLEGNLNITEVSYNVGFKYPTDFTNYFTKMFGISPRQFIKNQNK